MQERNRITRIVKLPKFGGRIGKTGAAVFLTGGLCYLLNMNPVFAIIAAIITIEPTTYDSIKKGIVRLPASLIGGAVAILLFLTFGTHPLTYAAAAVGTIYICRWWRLEEGALIATITAVAMIPNLSGAWVYDFSVKIAATTLGLTVSTIINASFPSAAFIDLSKKRASNVEQLIGRLLFITESDPAQVIQSRQEVAAIRKDLDAEKKEWLFHRPSFAKKRNYLRMQQRLERLERMLCHIEQLQHCYKAKSLPPLLQTYQHQLGRQLLAFQYAETQRFHKQVEDFLQSTSVRLSSTACAAFELLRLHEIVHLHVKANQLKQRKAAPNKEAARIIDR
ncbi:uncharacterized membrane protein YgaE (UPF0421/DUF939 family) [Salsuginibacillus halophilus]|uniref:Uncharacterized membrane protein YgaE (UPF0421/DUF939 family) n=1 Tax=Salsuginibacillus halophilus TaxID=517424 RepID=A0A2P8HWG0_9BACI|nr:aromatic acid exporter family protein [Salsuginibacillus halophilus]PSL50571.1 uncharacterized membrane protein YgaE (UPF0421/DUF939 family) [Salsuginibacillus halophilus]